MQKIERKNILIVAYFSARRIMPTKAAAQLRCPGKIAKTTICQLIITNVRKYMDR